MVIYIVLVVRVFCISSLQEVLKVSSRMSYVELTFEIIKTFACSAVLQITKKSSFNCCCLKVFWLLSALYVSHLMRVLSVSYLSIQDTSSLQWQLEFAIQNMRLCVLTGLLCCHAGLNRLDLRHSRWMYKLMLVPYAISQSCFFFFQSDVDYLRLFTQSLWNLSDPFKQLLPKICELPKCESWLAMNTAVSWTVLTVCLLLVLYENLLHPQRDFLGKKKVSINMYKPFLQTAASFGDLLQLAVQVFWVWIWVHLLCYLPSCVHLDKWFPWLLLAEIIVDFNLLLGCYLVQYMGCKTLDLICFLISSWHFSGFFFFLSPLVFFPSSCEHTSLS